MDFLSLLRGSTPFRMGAMRRRVRGFTLIEVLVTILIGAILTSIAVKGFGLTSSEMSVRQARNVFTGMVARARAMAIERGTLTRFYVDPAGDSISLAILRQSPLGWEQEEAVYFGGDMGIDIQKLAGSGAAADDDGPMHLHLYFLTIFHMVNSRSPFPTVS